MDAVTAVADRFWSKVDIRGPKECWPWTRSRVPAGYGQLMVTPGHPERSNRLAWQLTNGPIPDGLVVRHDCDNPPCCNPAHLRLGTQLDNIADMHERGRARGGSVSRPGEMSPLAKISAVDVAEIRRLRAGGGTCREIAATFNISAGQISRILTGKRWKHLAEPSIAVPTSDVQRREA